MRIEDADPKPGMRYGGPAVTSNGAEAWLQNARETYGLVIRSLVLEGAI